MINEINALRAKSVALKLGIAESTLHDWCNPKSPRYDPTFPKFIRLGTSTVVWLSNMIEAWLIRKYEEQNGPLPQEDQNSEAVTA